ncbi:MAG: glutathione synthase [Betaproteobacteria bacterium]|nr:glutathione synthase [Betaproteobacteria bacterium]
MKLAFCIDPLEKLKPAKDSTIAMMRAAAKRGHEVYAFEPRDMAASSATVVANIRKLTVRADNANWFDAEPHRDVALSAFAAVLMRKDPPFDMEFFYATLLLELAESQGVIVINRPRSLRDYNEKFATHKFPRFTVPMLVTKDIARLNAFIDAQSDVILKKLDGMGGTSIFRVRKDDPNRNAIIEVQTVNGAETIMAQRYIPEIVKGDKRVLVINGKPAPYCLARIPKAGETRGNLAAGGKGVAQPISDRDREIAETIGPQLVADGLLFVGLDVIGDYLTEVNVTSPTCMVEIFEQTGFDAATWFIEAVEKVAAGR